VSTAADNQCEQRRRHTGRRIGRALLFLFFSYPYAIVTVPLAVYLLGHVVLSLPGFFASYSAGDRQNALSRLPFMAAVAVFALLSVGYAVLEFLEGWRGATKQNDKKSE
jgi:uncharacterized membrane protein YdjX (TVP38/TMEM64 family)